MSFADLETRVNAAAIRRLSNATATVSAPLAAAGEGFSVIFDAAYRFVDALGTASAAPAAAAQLADMPAAVRAALLDGSDVTLTINGTAYSVVEPQPDGTGWTVLRLRS